MDTVIIKKFQNGKLFNIQGSHYTTLEEIFTLMQKNISFQVICNKSKRDITIWFSNECKLRFCKDLQMPNI
jgi:polyhydroxyalkanoate synthesis regulator protein